MRINLDIFFHQLYGNLVKSGGFKRNSKCLGLIEIKVTITLMLAGENKEDGGQRLVSAMWPCIILT